jgi:hypothetical protein
MITGRLLTGGTDEFRRELADWYQNDSGFEPEREPMSIEQRRELELLAATELIKIMRRVHAVAHTLDDDARELLAKRLDTLSHDASEAAKVLRRRRGQSNISPVFDIASSPFLRRQAGDR